MNSESRLWSVTGAVFLAGAVAALWVWPKLFGAELHPIFGWIEARTGLSWFEPGVRQGVGVMAAAAVVLVLLPRTRLLGSAAALAMAAVFIVAHLTPWLGVDVPAYEPLTEALAAGRTADEIAALGLGTDKGAHFTLALTVAGLALVTFVAERAARRRPPPKPARIGLASA